MIKTEGDIKIFTPKVHAEYDYMNWHITVITDFRNEDFLFGYAVLKKYAHLLNYCNYHFSNEILKENNVFIDEEDPEDYEAVFDLEDDVACRMYVYDPVTEAQVLAWLVREIDIINGVYDGCSILDVSHRTVVLKQLYKKTQPIKSPTKSRGFKQIAWATMVKERDGKCVECGSIYELHAHHVVSFKNAPDLRFDVNNGVTLCGDCHRAHHKKNGR